MRNKAVVGRDGSSESLRDNNGHRLTGRDRKQGHRGTNPRPRIVLLTEHEGSVGESIRDHEITGRTRIRGRTLNIKRDLPTDTRGEVKRNGRHAGGRRGIFHQLQEAIDDRGICRSGCIGGRRRRTDC